MDIPKYQTVAGQSFRVGSLNKADRRLRIQNTTVDECKEYALLLERSGFAQYAAKEIPSGSDATYNVNLFYTYCKDSLCVFLFWDASLHTTFITVEPSQALPTAKAPAKEACERTAVTLTQLRLKKGMCYVVQLKNGEFIVVDGGIEHEPDEENLYDFLLSKAPRGKTPRIALWLFTHAHNDHIQLATSFLVHYKNAIDVRAFAYQFADHDKIPLAMENVEDIKRDIDRLEESMKNGYPDARFYTLHTGQSYYFEGLEAEILFSPDNTYPSHYISLNDMSVALRLNFENGKKVLLLGDCMHDACRQLFHTYGEYLKSDVLQVAHHGLIGGDKKLYQCIDPDVCFWSIEEERFLGRTPNQRYQWCLGEGGCDYNSFLRDDGVRKRAHYHAGVTTTLEIE